MDDYHITKSGNHWIIKKQGAEPASKTADKKAEIIKLAIDSLEGKTASLKTIRKMGPFRKKARTHVALTRSNLKIKRF
ncbi:DUF2188 domain-containing protein [Pseudomonas proteolytica]|uniref:DUF2188 domain-containing protein n=1 Tax=Pseudomonas TaxID=286 RepID=UPI003BB8087A